MREEPFALSAAPTKKRQASQGAADSDPSSGGDQPRLGVLALALCSSYWFGVLPCSHKARALACRGKAPTYGTVPELRLP